MKSNKALVKMSSSRRRSSHHRSVGEKRNHRVARRRSATQEGLERTPERVEQALRFLTSGYSVDIPKLVNNALYEVKYDEMVIVKDIEFFSMCEHHMLPFYGKMHVAYLPKTRVIGLSKIPRIVDAFARRLQIQERLTQQVAQTIQQTIDPVGVGVICEASHFCMMMRGGRKASTPAR